MESTSPATERLRRWLLALACFAVVIFFFSPSWSAFTRWSRVPEMSFQIEVRRGLSVLAQVEHPGAPVADPLHRAIQWRLLFPLIGRVLRLPPAILFSLAPLGSVLVLGYLITLLRRARADWCDTTLAVIVFAAASWFFTSSGWLGYFDSWLALALLLIAFAETRWALWGACLWAPWVDERFAIAAPLALFCRYLWATKNHPSTPTTFNWRDHGLVPAGLIAAFVAVRLGVLANYSDAGATPGGYLAGKNFLGAPASRIPLGIWDGLRGAWLFAVLALVFLRSRAASALGLAAATLAVLGTGLATAQDYSRAMTMVLPVAGLGLLLLIQSQASWTRLALCAAAGGALLLPAHHVMNDRVDRIFYLYHELDAFDHPSQGATPDFYELRSIHKMERGDFASAENDLTLAIKLSANPASPAKQRGILRASRQRWAEAEQDFALVVLHDPKNPEAWFMHAQAQFALGDAAHARSDLDQARSLAGADWTTRPDVARFMAKLNSR